MSMDEKIINLLGKGTESMPTLRDHLCCTHNPVLPVVYWSIPPCLLSLCTVSQTPTPAHHDGACFRSNRGNDDGDCSSGGTGSVSASRLALGTSASYAAGGGGGSPASARRAATVWRHSRSSSGGSRGELSTLPSVASSSDHFDLVSFCCRGGAL